MLHPDRPPSQLETGTAKWWCGELWETKHKHQTPPPYPTQATTLEPHTLAVFEPRTQIRCVQCITNDSMAWGLWREIVGLIAKVPESKDIAVYGRSDTTRGGGVMTRTRARFRWTTQVTRAARLMLDWPGVRARAHRGPLEGEKRRALFFGLQ